MTAKDHAKKEVMSIKHKLIYVKPSYRTRKLMKELCKDMAQALESLAKK